MTKTAHPRVEIEGKGYVIVPEDIYQECIASKRPASRTNAGLIAEIESGDAETVSVSDFRRELLADDLKRERKRAGLSQGRLAKLSGMRIETISRIEQQKTMPRSETVEALFTVLASVIKSKEQSHG